MKLQGTLIAYLLFCFTGWSLPFEQIGDVSVQNGIVVMTTINDTGGPGSVPISGTFATGTAPIESFIGVPAKTLDQLGYSRYPASNPLSRHPVVGGSAIAFDVTVTKPSTLSLQWNFLANGRGEYYPDFAFFTSLHAGVINGQVVGGAVESLSSSSPLSDIVLKEAPSFYNDPTQESGFSTFQFNLTEPGTYHLGIGVVDVNDPFTASGLEISNVRIPDSGSSLFLMALALPLLVACYGQRKSMILTEASVGTIVRACPG